MRHYRRSTVGFSVSSPILSHHPRGKAQSIDFRDVASIPQALAPCLPRAAVAEMPQSPSASPRATYRVTETFLVNPEKSYQNTAPVVRRVEIVSRVYPAMQQASCYEAYSPSGRLIVRPARPVSAGKASSRDCEAVQDVYSAAVSCSHHVRRRASHVEMPVSVEPAEKLAVRRLSRGGKPVRVLAFGDSLTCGTVRGASSHPYTRRLERLLGRVGSVRTAGWPGQCAGNMMNRLSNELAGHGIQGALAGPPPPFTHVVVLAGTNDLRVGTDPEHIFDHLRELHSAITKTGAVCIVVTLPQYGPKDTVIQPVTAARQTVNEGLRACAAHNINDNKDELIHIADLDEALSTLPIKERNALFSDGCHFTSRGYDLLADVVFAGIEKTSDPGSDLETAGSDS